MTTSSSDYLRDVLRQHIEVIQQLCKGRPPGIDPAMVRPGCLYVLDWRPERPGDHDSIRVEEVISVEADGAVLLTGSTTDLATFARLVVAGPFPLVDGGPGA